MESEKAACGARTLIDHCDNPFEKVSYMVDFQGNQRTTLPSKLLSMRGIAEPLCSKACR